MPNSQVIIELKNINKVYDQEVLKVDYIRLKKGNIHGIIGPSGSGKSTLLRIINLLTPPSDGSYYFCDGYS